MARKVKTKDRDVATVVGSDDTKSTDLLPLLKSRLKVAKVFCKKPHESWRRWISEYEIDDIADTDEIRDKVRIGYVFRKTETELPAVFDDQPELFIKGRNDDLKQLEPLFEGLYDYLWDIQLLDEKIENAGLYFGLLGMAFISSPYVTKTKKIKQVVDMPLVDELGQPVLDETGQPVTAPQEQEYEVPIVDNPEAEVEDPFKMYFSPETKFNLVLDYEHCPYYFKEKSMTVEAVKARFNKDVESQEKLHTNDTEIDTEVDNEYREHSDDLKRVTVYEYYGCLPENLAKNENVKASEPWSYDKDYHIYFTNNELLLAEECPYTTKPCFVLGNYGLANKFWKFGDAKHLIPLVQELERYRSQILNHTRKMANPKALIEMNSEVDEATFSDPRVGKSVKYTGTPPTYLAPSPLGREVQVGVDMARTDLEKTAPSFDLAGGGGQSQVRSPRGIQVFAEASDRGVRRKRKKVARFIRQLMMFQFGQIAANWKAEDNKQVEVNGRSEIITAEVLQVLSDPNILNRLDIEVESLSVNRVQMKQESLELFELAAKYPNLFNLTELAKGLLQSGYHLRDADRYLISEDQKVTAMLQQVASIISQTNPEAAMEVVQLSQNPQVIQSLSTQSTGQGGAPQLAPPPMPVDQGLADMPPLG